MGMGIGNFLKLQGALERGRIVAPPPEIKEIATGVMLLGAALKLFDLLQNFNAMLENYINENAEFQYFSPNAVFCGPKSCSQIQNRKSLFSDPWHLSSYGADLVGERIFNFVKKMSLYLHYIYKQRYRKDM